MIHMERGTLPGASNGTTALETRGYQQEMLEESLRRNIIIAMDTGSGKTHVAVLRLKHESERELKKLSWFLAPTVALCEQQYSVIKGALPVSVGLISGALAPDQWKDATLWKSVLSTHQVMVSTPQVLLDAFRHGYIVMGKDIGLIVFDEAHHAVDNDPYNRIMQEFYFHLPPNDPSLSGVAYGHDRIKRPMILGLTASPIFGGNVDRAFKMIEGNLDSSIVSPRQHRSELEGYVHRPIFKHILYHPPDEINSPFSTNLAALYHVQSTLQIEDDPYIKSLRNQLSKTAPNTTEYYRIDQRLSKTIASEGTFTHKGIRDFVRTASEILRDVGVWATDWYIWEMLQQAKKAAGASEHIMPSWQSQEKAYLLSIINRIRVTPVSYHPDDIIDEQSDKVAALIECLHSEKDDAEAANETFSGLIFVQRRDVVLALSELLKNHPMTRTHFQVGPLLGASDSSHRHAFLDITRRFFKQSQDETLMDFKIGDKNLIVSTSVAEEGIDVQACGCVIRWDPPPNVVSWAQSRGRARKQRSTFIMMFEEGAASYANVSKWETLEKEMIARYMDASRTPKYGLDETDGTEEDDEPPFRVESTGALLTVQSAIPHLNHFCAVMPNRSHFEYLPLYDLDPPDHPIGWHSFDNRSMSMPYTGPWASTLTLPRILPPELRVFKTLRIYGTKVAAHRHVAFEAYKALYNAGLLSDFLLPLFDDDDPEVEELKKEVEKRTGMASVSLQMDPWAPEGEARDDSWFISELMVETLPPLQILTRRPTTLWTVADNMFLYHPSLNDLCMVLRLTGKLALSDSRIISAREYTRKLFWSLNGSRMHWDDIDFSYLVLPPSPECDDHWEARRTWLKDLLSAGDVHSQSSPANAFNAPAMQFGERFDFPQDLSIIRDGSSFAKPYEFVAWRWEPLGDEEEAKIREHYARFSDLEIKYPLLEVRSFHPRTNFLLPRSSKSTLALSSRYLLPQHSSVVLITPAETLYAFLLPSVLRALALHLTADSLRASVFTDQSPLSMIPNDLLINALCTPVSQEPKNYQRLETLGDTMLKFVVAIQLLAQHPLWPEGYLTKRKDHAVSNVRLAKENVDRELFKWIIRDRLVGKKWTPLYHSALDSRAQSSEESPGRTDANPTGSSKTKEEFRQSERDESVCSPEGLTEGTLPGQAQPFHESVRQKKGKSKKNSHYLSTKVLADVVESLIGAAYIYGGLDLGYECAKFFRLNIDSWLPIPRRIEEILQRSDENLVSLLSCSATEELQFPPQLASVERLISYTFNRPLLLLEALTHPSCQEDHGTISYERMEFLGDAVLDMIVTDFLYRAKDKDGLPKDYSPGHMHLRKSAIVNAHILAFACLRAQITQRAQMPKPLPFNGPEDSSSRRRGEQKIVLEDETQTIHLWKCLLHSSTRILDEQQLTFGRFIKRQHEIEDAFENGRIFPWAALTRVQAPKFFSDMIESILGAVFIDSEGNLDVVREVMRALGLYQTLERIVVEDIDVLHPVSRLAMWAAKQLPTKQIEYDYVHAKGRISCGILINGEELEGSRVEDNYSGKSSKEEVRLAAAESAIKMLHLRDVGVQYSLLKGRNKPKRKAMKGNK